MKWLNLEIRFAKSPAVAGADTLDVGIWIRLLLYCGDFENGGRITGARLWNSCQWIRVVGVTEEEVHREAPGLWSFADDDLVVEGYPVAQEEKVKANRENGKLGGRPADPEKPHGKPHGKPRENPNRKRKRNVKENTTTTRTPGSELSIHPSDLDEYGPAPNSEHPDADPLWKDFLEYRRPFERFDDFRDRFAPDGPPASN